MVGSNPYKLVRSSISSKIYPAVGTEGGYLNEMDALKNLGIDYGSIKTQFRKKIEEAKADGTYLTSALRIPDITFASPGGEIRTYEVSGVVMKDKDGSGIQNIASRFETVTGGKTTIALVIDASGGLSMTSLMNTDIDPLPNNKTRFYILENIENDSDSATKLKTLDKPKNTEKERIDKQPDVFFLRDVESTALYPNFKLDKSDTDAELLFGNATLLLSRAGDEMEADFTFDDGTTYHIDNVSQSANVKNASLNILASALAEGGRIEDDTLIVPDTIKKPFLFPYIKRVGDWCQALSLLDMSREYAVSDLSHTATDETTTLNELKQGGAVIGLLTLDRILLGYALTLGIDVFFTTATDLRLLLHFHNKEVQLSEEEMRAKIEELKPQYDAQRAEIGSDKVVSILDEGVAFVKAATDDVDYIRRLRGTLYRVSMLRSDFASLTEKIKSIDEELTTERPATQTFMLYFEGSTILRKLKADEIHNEIQRQSFSTYPALVNDKSAYDMIESRPQSRVAATKLKVILSKGIFNDALQTHAIFQKYNKEPLLVELVETTPQNPDVFGTIFSALEETRILFGASQVGGGESDIEPLKQFIITPLTSEDYEQRTVDPPVDEPLPLIKGSYYRDKKSMPYTVVDEYIITKEDQITFQRIASFTRSRLRNSPEDEKFLATRLMLLYVDILQGDMERLVATEDEEDESTPSDVKDAGHRRIYYLVSQLQDIYSKLLEKEDWMGAFQESFQEYEGAALLDNETVNSIATGRSGLRSPTDYRRTFDKIEVLRSGLLTTIVVEAPQKLGKRKRSAGRKTRRTKKFV